MGFHIVKRDNCPLWKKCCFYLAAVVAALLLGNVLANAFGSPVFFLLGVALCVYIFGFVGRGKK